MSKTLKGWIAHILKPKDTYYFFPGTIPPKQSTGERIYEGDKLEIPKECLEDYNIEGILEVELIIKINN